MNEEDKKTKETTRRKSPWRYLFAACAVFGALSLLESLWMKLICWGVQVWDHFSTDTMAVSIGVIGGADGPTAIFVTSPPWVHNLIPALMLIVGIWGFLRLSRCRQKE